MGNNSKIEWTDRTLEVMRSLRKRTGLEVKDAVFTEIDPDSGFLIGWRYGVRTVLCRSTAANRQLKEPT